MAQHDRQILVVLDIYPGVPLEVLKQQLPAEREERLIIKLSDLGAPQLKPPPDTTPVDWLAIGKAVEQAADRVHEFQAGATGNTVVFIAGKAPLAAFVHLGYRFTKSLERCFLFCESLGGGSWQPFAVDTVGADGAEVLNEHVKVPDEPSSATGRLCIAFDSGGRRPGAEVFRELLKKHGESCAEVVQLRSSERLLVTPENFGALMQQLNQFMSKAPAMYPERTGLAVFVGGPVQLAFAVGKAMSPNVLGGNIWLTEYRSPGYELVYSLPFKADENPVVPQDPESRLARREVLEEMKAGIEELKRALKPEHLPIALLPEADRDKFVKCLKDLELSKRSIGAEPFELRVIERRCTLANEGIQHAFVQSTGEQQRSFAKLLVLHELIHDWQTLRSTNYTAIGRAGFVLEQIDYAADAFALHTLMNIELARGGDAAKEEVSKRLQSWIEMILHGIESFGLMEQGNRMDRLPERRLRRYLVWYLQLARAATVAQPADVDEMLRPVLTVELAPLAGYIDTQRHDKVVTRALPETELFIAIGGNLVRAPRRAGFEPGAFVDLVRTYSPEPIRREMAKVVDEHRGRLAPWSA